MTTFSNAEDQKLATLATATLKRSGANKPQHFAITLAAHTLQ
jgi:hypothetical protein